MLLMMEVFMRGLDKANGSLFSYVDLEERVPTDHPLRTIRRLVDDTLASLDDVFSSSYSSMGRPSIAPERLLRALLLQVFYSIRSERQLMEQLDYNLLYRWFVGVNPGLKRDHHPGVKWGHWRLGKLIPIANRRAPLALQRRVGGACGLSG